jgi:tRNA(Arg) A34 adenosine deaminase TadA
MAGKLKSLGLSGARKAGSKAMRKLFGRESPAVKGGSGDPASAPASDLEQTVNSSSDQAHTHQQHNHHPPTSEEDGGDQFNNKSESAGSQQVDSSETQQPAPDNGTSLPRTTDDDVTMRALQAQQQQRLPSRTAENQGRTPFNDGGKENQPPVSPDRNIDVLTKAVNKLSLSHVPEPVSRIEPPATDIEVELDEETKAEQEKNLFFIGEALDMVRYGDTGDCRYVRSLTGFQQARLALKTNETPVGCVLVHNDKVIARGMNATNVTRNGTRHAEFMAVCALLSYPPKNGPRSTCLRPKVELKAQDEADDDASTISPQPDEGNEDGRKGHLYPYGQKEHPDERVDRNIIRESTLYVTVEPCIMCASLLRQMGIKKVYFGAVNDKFGGTGGVFSIHANSLPVEEDGQTASAHPQTPPMQLPRGGQVLGTSFPPSGGDGGNVEPGFEIEGGWGRDEAVGLLRRFYVQENERGQLFSRICRTIFYAIF